MRDKSKYAKLSFRYDDDVLIEGVFINGRKVIANLDTGGGGDSLFKLTSKAMTDLGLENKLRDAHARPSAGYNGQYQSREGQLNATVSVGPFSVDSPIVEIFPKGTGHDNKGWTINIGNAFLKD